MLMMLRSMLLATFLATAPEPSSASRHDNTPAAPDIVQACRYVDPRFGWLATVSWIDNSDDEHGFIVQWRSPQGGSGSITLGSDVTLSPSLPSGRGFRYRVGAFRVFGGTAWSRWMRESDGC